MEYSVFGCSAHALMNHRMLAIEKEAIQSMFGFILNEPSQEKNNDLHMLKTKMKISCVVTAHRGLYQHFLTLTMTTQVPV